MLDDSTKKDISKVSLELLKSSKSYGVYPTPVQQIVAHANLKIATKGLIIKEPGIFERFSSLLMQGLDKVRGALDRSEKTIYLNIDQDKRGLRKNFVTLHEVGHDVIPWQSQTLGCLDSDETLDPDTEEAFEAEANYFASLTLFQHNLFAEQFEKLELGIKAPLHLSKTFGASIHSTLRRYVEENKKRIALLVLKDISKKGSLPNCSVRNYFQSPKFTKEFGRVTWPEQLGYTWPFVPYYYHNRRLVENDSVLLNTKNGEVQFSFHFFCNSYNAFVLIFPKGEKNRTRTKIILTK
ncbi:MAG: hypothetical protein RL204_995 [Bacteroidota bacterium]|jgi:Zn-dependent peptidase ImmA (M78 family)